MKLKTGRHTSVLKEARKNVKRRLVNKAVKSRIKTAIKKFESALTEKNAEKAKELLKAVSSVLDKAAKRNVIHRKNASRKISRLAQRLAKFKK
ncbi:MAG: 30S ribosomal protein S20 [Elusimicrobia bacterium RIFOXYD2_FULL_34_15]|nr:MAG: 30S ribosomal protein S20 [Elusimicrobia bacterium RIFOXYD2_FULL_34_15]